MSRLFVNFILISIISSMTVNCQQTELETEVRIMKASNCNVPGLKWFLQNISISYAYPRTLLNIDLNITEGTKVIKKMLVHLDRCNDQGFNCEDFQTWYLDNTCSLLNLKHQTWSDFVSALKPKFRCPIMKTVYKGRNITLDYSPVMRWYPDSVKYHWKAEVKLVNERDELVYCANFEAYAYQYRKKNKH